MDMRDAPRRAEHGQAPVASVREPRLSSASFIVPPSPAADLAEGADAVEVQAWLRRFAARAGASAACYFQFGHLPSGQGAPRNLPSRMVCTGEADDAASALLCARALAAVVAAPLPAAAVVAEQAGEGHAPFTVLVPVRDDVAGAACLCLACDDGAAAAWSLSGGYAALVEAAQRLHAIAATALPPAGARAAEQVLTDRECACLRLAAAGETLSATATTLGVAPRTVEAHLARATRKLRAANKINAVAIAIGSGLLRV